MPERSPGPRPSASSPMRKVPWRPLNCMLRRLPHAVAAWQMRDAISPHSISRDARQIEKNRVPHLRIFRFPFGTGESSGPDTNPNGEPIRPNSLRAAKIHTPPIPACWISMFAATRAALGLTLRLRRVPGPIRTWLVRLRNFAGPQIRSTPLQRFARLVRSQSQAFCPCFRNRQRSTHQPGHPGSRRRAAGSALHSW